VPTAVEKEDAGNAAGRMGRRIEGKWRKPNGVHVSMPSQWHYK